jgi:hypothetical protein
VHSSGKNKRAELFFPLHNVSFCQHQFEIRTWQAPIFDIPVALNWVLVSAAWYGGHRAALIPMTALISSNEHTAQINSGLWFDFL